MSEYVFHNISYANEAGLKNARRLTQAPAIAALFAGAKFLKLTQLKLCYPSTTIVARKQRWASPRYDQARDGTP
jgi:hypothetical protein